jgi:hypothetical protein
MTREHEVLTNLVKSMIDNGTLDQIVIAVLEDALDSAFKEMERVYQRKHLEAHHWQDYADSLLFSHACIKVLRYFSLDGYEKEDKIAKEYSLRIEEL